MPSPWVIAVAAVVALALMFLLALKPLRRMVRRGEARHARQLFLRQREHLEAKFFSVAAASGKPRGLRWKNCEWENPVEFAREKDTGKLAALVGVTIQFEAVEGSDMEGLPAVGNLRNASAVFFFDRGGWHTVGKAVFNMNPDEAIQHYQYERVEVS